MVAAFYLHSPPTSAFVAVALLGARLPFALIIGYPLRGLCAIGIPLRFSKPSSGYESIVNTPYNGFQLDLGTTAAGSKNPTFRI